MPQGTGWGLARLITGVEYGSLKLINRAVGSLKFELVPATFGIVVEVVVDVVDIDADVGIGTNDDVGARPGPGPGAGFAIGFDA